MPTITKALFQVHRYIEHTNRYLSEMYGNLRLEAQHGFTESPEWYLTDEAKATYEQYGTLLNSALVRINEVLPKHTPYRSLVRFLRNKAEGLRRDLDTQETEPGFLAFRSPLYAEWEVTCVFLDILKGDMYISRSYDKWNTIPTNRWYHTPYLPDEGALAGIIFWVNPQTRLVLFGDGLQLRWRHGRVLLDVKYADIATITEFARKRREHWKLTQLDGREHIIDVSWVHDLPQLKVELTQKSVEFVRSLGKDATVRTARKSR